MKRRLRTILTALTVCTSLLLGGVSVSADTDVEIIVNYQLGYESDQGSVYYSLDGGSTWLPANGPVFWDDVTVTSDRGIGIKVVASAGYVIPTWEDSELNGLDLNSGEYSDIRDQLEGMGYFITGNVDFTAPEFEEKDPDDPGQYRTNWSSTFNITVRGEDFGYYYDNPTDIYITMNGGVDPNAPEGENNQFIPFKIDNCTFDQDPPNTTEATMNNPVEYHYSYDNSGTVSFSVNYQTPYIFDKFEINGTDYSDRTPKTLEERLAGAIYRGETCVITGVPVMDHYDIVIEGHSEPYSGSFGWNYRGDDEGGSMNIAHGTLEFVKAEYNGITYTTPEAFDSAANYFGWDELHGEGQGDIPGGGIYAPMGTLLTLRLIPDPGYQLIGLNFNGMHIDVDNDNVYTFTFEVPAGSYHVNGEFVKTDNEARVSSGSVSNATIDIRGNDGNVNGTYRLDVNDANVSSAAQKKFEEAAEGRDATILSYMDLSLYNTIYKGGLTDESGNYLSWDTPVADLQEDSSITLGLNGDLSNAREVFVIHETHDGKYEIIDSFFDSSNNSVSFNTDSFSNYAVAVVENSNTNPPPAPPPGGDDNPTPGGGGDPQPPADITYKLTDGDFTFTFTDGPGNTFTFNAFELLGMTEAQRTALGISASEFRAGADAISAALDDQVLAFYMISLMHDDGEEVWGRENSVLSIKLPSSVLEYDNLQLYDITDFGDGVAPIKLEYKISNGVLTTEARDRRTFVLTGVDPNAEPEEDNIGDFVERLYDQILGRGSDEAGKADWIGRIVTGGGTGADIVRGFLYSPEFREAAATMSDTDFVSTLYRSIFGREPDSEGLQNWVNAIGAGQSRDFVIDSFIDSTEWANLCLTYGIPSGGKGVPNITREPNAKINDFVTRLYQYCLSRKPDPAGLADWSDQLANLKISGSQAAFGFFFSDEFQALNTTDGEYVELLYKTILGRPSDPDGFASWVKILADGASREEVYEGFARSDEFGIICADYGIIR